MVMASSFKSYNNINDIADFRKMVKVKLLVSSTEKERNKGIFTFNLRGRESALHTIEYKNIYLKMLIRL